MIEVAIMGHGVVGSGVAEILLEHWDAIAQKAKNEINVKYILDLKDFSHLYYSDKFIKDFNIILRDPEIRVVVEVMGGINPAYEFVKACLHSGKSVVTSNKELVAAKGAELLQIANEKNVNFLFEASVGGGIPVLRPIAQCLAANELSEIVGILNGTTNFILTKMIKEKVSFEDALKQAQDLGYAEKDPTADVEGHDACRKICILASLGFGKHVYPEQVQTEGITKIDLFDAAYAEKLGYVIKLIGHAKKMDNGKITANVYPALINKDNMLSGVNDVFNAVMVYGDAIGQVMFYGRGAGKSPTASAVVADVIDCVKHLVARKYLSWADGDKNYVCDGKKALSKLFVRLNAENVSETKNAVCAVFGEDTVIIEGVKENELAFLTEYDIEEVLTKKISKFDDKIAKVLHVLD